MKCRLRSQVQREEKKKTHPQTSPVMEGGKPLSNSPREGENCCALMYFFNHDFHELLF